jgi:Secretion system C-terminal sorting domain/Kazal-type serine protease inhibitor domain
MIDPGTLCPAIFDPVCGCDSVTYENSCVAMYHNGVTIYTPGACPTNSIFDIQKGQIKLFPNPANDELWIEMNGIGKGQIEIHDVRGKLISTTKGNGSDKVRVDIQLLESGMYLITVISADGSMSSMRFVKE